jgi:uncharacterized protein YecT (DUF1311 family)
MPRQKAHRPCRGSNADARSRGGARGGYGGVRQKLAACMINIARVRNPTRGITMKATKLIVLAALIALACDSARSQPGTLQPYELTSRGVIADKAQQSYREAIEACRNGDSSSPPAACLRRQLRENEKTLSAVYKNSIEFLKFNPGRIARLRGVQRAWIQFRYANCEFARSVAPTDHGDEFFYDCLLRTTIERTAELGSLIGD